MADMTVVLCTYNRAERIGQTVKAVLAQEDCELELVVVDDGSTDATPEVLASIDDPRLRVVRRPNGGLSQARNSGLDAARGEWTVFLDDDDRPEPRWVATLLAPTDDPAVGISCCAATYVNAADEPLYIHEPQPMGEIFGSRRGSWLAGTFAARTDLLRRAGGYLSGLGARHQTELFLRLVHLVEAEGRRIATSPEAMIRIEARPATERPSVNPRRLYDATRWILTRHPEAFRGHPTTIARYESVIGAAAARLGDWGAARRHLARAARATPTSPRGWGRLGLAAVPPVGRLVWNRHGAFASHDVSELGIRRQDGAEPDPGERELFLPWGYQENPARGTAPDPATVSALRRRAGSDQSLQLCVEALERVDDPVEVLRRLRQLDRPVLLAADDRAMTDPDRPLGPPRNPENRREWTFDQLELLLLSTGFDIERTWWLGSRRRGRRALLLSLRG